MSRYFSRCSVWHIMVYLIYTVLISITDLSITCAWNPYMFLLNFEIITKSYVFVRITIDRKGTFIYQIYDLWPSLESGECKKNICAGIADSSHKRWLFTPSNLVIWTKSVMNILSQFCSRHRTVIGWNDTTFTDESLKLLFSYVPRLKHHKLIVFLILYGNIVF